MDSSSTVKISSVGLTIDNSYLMMLRLSLHASILAILAEVQDIRRIIT